MADWSELIEAAQQAQAQAYAPYSEYHVGSALLSEGKIHAGCNVENASYGLTMCAERSALAKAISEGQREFVALAVWSSTPRPLMPCGACRQVLHEFAPSLRVLVAGGDAPVKEFALSALLPEAVGPADLGA